MKNKNKMKNKFLLLIAVILMSATTSFAQQMVTFQVESPDSTPVYVFGSWSSWSNFPGDAMTLIAPNKYSVTLSIASSTTHEFLFVNGTATESMDPTAACTNMNTQYTNRVINVGTADTAVCYTWETCTSCTVTPPPPPPAQINVTFQVESPDSLPVSLIGSWNWANFPGPNMTSVGPNQYAVTLQLDPSTAYEFLYVNGATSPIAESMDPTTACTNMNTQYTNRTLSLGANDTTICFEWENCTACTVAPPPTPLNVTFQVQSPDSLPVHVFGNWSNWSNFPGDVMTSIGNNTYEVTLQINPSATIEYQFVGGVQDNEVLDPTLACTNMNTQFPNRATTIGTNDTTFCYTWETCDACIPLSLNEISKDELSIMVSSSYIRLNATELNEVDGLEIFDVVGRTVFASQGKVKTNQNIDVDLLSNKLYLIRVRNGNAYQTIKSTIIK